MVLPLSLYRIETCCRHIQRRPPHNLLQNAYKIKEEGKTWEKITLENRKILGAVNKKPMNNDKVILCDRPKSESDTSAEGEGHMKKT